MSITRIEDIKKACGAQEVSLTGWEPGTSFTCRLRRPSLYELAASGSIPNPLLSVVDELFRRDTAALQKRDIAEQAKAFLKLAEMALMEPTLSEMHDAGASLTDQQLMEIYAFIMGGAGALKGFRGGTGRAAGNDGQANERKSKRPSQD